MMLNPRPGQLVQIWYNKRAAEYMPYHGMLATVARPSRGKPRNHGVILMSGKCVIVPCGNLRKVKP